MSLPWNPSFSNLNKPSSLNLLHTRSVSALWSFHGLPLDPLLQLCTLPVLETSDLNSLLHMGTHDGTIEVGNHLLCPVSHLTFETVQDTVGLLYCKCTLQSARNLGFPQLKYIILHLALLIPINFSWDHIPLDGMHPCCCVNCTTQLGLNSKPDDGTVDLTVYVIDKGLEEHWPQDKPFPGGSVPLSLQSQK